MGVEREMDLMKSFPVFEPTPRAEATTKVWSTCWCHRRKGPEFVRSRFVVRQFADSGDSVFYSPTPGLEVTRVLLALALVWGSVVLFGDISVAL